MALRVIYHNLNATTNKPKPRYLYPQLLVPQLGLIIRMLCMRFDELLLQLVDMLDHRSVVHLDANVHTVAGTPAREFPKMIPYNMVLFMTQKPT